VKGHFVFDLTLDAKHPLCESPDLAEFRCARDNRYGREVLEVHPDGYDKWASLFQLVSPSLDDLSIRPWSMGRIYGFDPS
jgi:hypothetical protein